MKKRKTITVGLETWKILREIKNEKEKDGENTSLDEIIYNAISTNERRKKT